MSSQNAVAVIANQRPAWRTNVLYHRLMLPNWLRDSDKIEWNCPNEGNDLELVIKEDSIDWENIFRVPLIPNGVLDDKADITVKMKVGVLLPEPQQPRDPMSYMISDGDYSIGIQLLDPNHDYTTTGPYKPVEGRPRARKLEVVTSSFTPAPTPVRKNPDQFELTFKPSEFFGSAYCATDDGHKIVAQYADSLKLSKGLKFELYRFKSTERYTINYIEITVYEDSKPV
ncbi:uncharacterized protein [Porites lutea]|uniref:uncharacterized protein n=1 Tax=Porites lutea TaxID=51062 RepID=UPI003CC56995